MMTEAEVENIRATAVLQSEMIQLKADVKEIKVALQQITDLHKKGLGAFWLASSLVGIGIYLFFSWFQS